MVKTRFPMGTAARLALVVWILSAAAVAQVDSGLSGLGLIVGKDATQRTVTIEGGTVLHVASDTRLLNASGAAISFSQVPVAPGGNGLFARVPAASARYEARREGDRLVLRKLEVGVGFQD